MGIWKSGIKRLYFFFVLESESRGWLETEEGP